MDRIIDIMEDISTNIDEAHEKIEKAFRMKDVCPHYADWLSGMATAHLSLNHKGIETMEQLLEKPEYGGQVPVFQMWKAHAMKRSAKVKAMIDAFQR